MCFYIFDIKHIPIKNPVVLYMVNGQVNPSNLFFLSTMWKLLCQGNAVHSVGSVKVLQPAETISHLLDFVGILDHDTNLVMLAWNYLEERVQNNRNRSNYHYWKRFHYLGFQLSPPTHVPFQGIYISKWLTVDWFEFIFITIYFWYIWIFKYPQKKNGVMVLFYFLTF